MHLSQLSASLSLLLASANGLAIRQTPENDSSSTQGSGWTAATCEQSTIANANDLYVDRWNAAGVPEAWNSMTDEWKRSGKNSRLSFTQFASNYFHGPEQWNCANIGNVDCSTTVQCQDTSRPAGFLLLNAFSGIHQLHAETIGALQTAVTEIQSKIGDFTTTFAPQSDDSETIQAIIDSVTMIFGFGVSGIFAAVEGDIAKAAKGIGSKKSVAFDAEEFAHEMASQLVDITGAWIKEYVPQVHDELEAQNSLSSVVGDLFKNWATMEAKYLENIFSGEESSLQNLQNLIGDGKMNYMPSTLNQNAMTSEVLSVLYGQLMPTAWKTASNGAGAHPFVLKTDISCSDRSADFAEPNQSWLNDGYEGLMTDEDSAQTRVCWRGNWTFLVNANEWQVNSGVHFTPLPGGDNSTLSKNWGGITLEDIVSSAITGYEGRGGGKNGYKAPSMDEIMKDFNQRTYGKTVRYPGFFNLPVCESVEQAKSAIRTNHQANSPYWPCAEPPNYNSKGTTIHVNQGYININGKPVCDSFTISDPGYGDKLNATIYAGFDGSNTAEPTVSPTCKLRAFWPKSYGDIYYGEDNCLYDSESQQITDPSGNAQCCADSEGLPAVSNPYVAGAECQSS